MNATDSTLTAIIPTFERAQLLPIAIQALLDSERPPSQILVSEGSHGAIQRSATTEIVDYFHLRSSSECRISLLSEPSDGHMCANRNHLIRAVDTPYVVMIDDDCAIHSFFTVKGLELLQSGEAAIVTATSEPLTFDFRGFWKPAKPGQCPAISLKCVIGYTDVFQHNLLDECILYGSEDSDLLFRLQKKVPSPNVVQIGLVPEDNAEDETARFEAPEKLVLTVGSRVLVGIRRHWDSRPRLLAFIALEFGSYLLGRQPRPQACRRKQWLAVTRHLCGMASDPP